MALVTDADAGLFDRVMPLREVSSRYLPMLSLRAVLLSPNMSHTTPARGEKSFMFGTS